jgi:NTP pyrophosphatase (non-canonical NTP hydrolase)
MICPLHSIPLEFRSFDGGGQGEYFCPECRRPAQEAFAKLCRETPLPHGEDGERLAFDFLRAWNKPFINADTMTRAVDVHVAHASPQVGRFGSDDDIRFFALALAGEAGELANVVKKAWRDGKPLDREAALEELAGAACYLVGMAAALGCDLDAEMNKQMTAFESRPGRAIKTCSACDGSGRVGVYSDDGSPHPCGECGGTGCSRAG